MAFYAHQTYCLLEDSGILENDIYAWVLPSYRPIQTRYGLSRAIIIQLRGRKLTFDEMIRRDKSNASFKYPNSGIYPIFVPSDAFKKYHDGGKGKVLKLLKIYLDNPYYKNHVYLFTGHGEGGAFAIYAALNLFEITRGIKIEATTFGAPRIGDSSISYSLDCCVFVNRVTFKNDYVPLLLGPKFKHPNIEYWISDELSCACTFGNVNQKVFTIFQCDDGDGQESQNCNLTYENEFRKKLAEKPSHDFSSYIKSHNGPYFGYTMGKCGKNFNM
ncbi:hypothetical protein G9A89_006522 [Geosiphon pyriformis]|nr:hypothetical protein G9A89_006522 [Geosiphon pyriformis]